MKKEKIYKQCAAKLPHLRKCEECSHKKCALRGNRKKIDWDTEHTMIEHQEDMRDLAAVTEQ